MFSVEFAKRMKTFISVYSSFVFPIIITNSEYDYFWSNNATKKIFTGRNLKINVKDLLGELDLNLVNKSLLNDGSYIVSSIIPFRDLQVNIYPVMHPKTNEIDATILLFLEQDSLPFQDEVDFSSKTSDAFSDNIRHILNDVFSTIDSLTLEADIMGYDWMIPHFNNLGLNSYQVLRLSNNITAYNKLQNQQVDLNLSLLNLNQLIEKSAPSIISVGEIMNIPITFSLPDKAVYLPLDEVWFQTAFYNILHNSLYYTKKDNRIDISFELIDNSLTIIIDDKGLGISEDMLPNLFKPYRYSLTPERYPGLGLGLALASRIIHLHGGELTISSVKGEGTTATITFPVNITNSLPLHQSYLGEDIWQTDSVGDKFSPLHIGLTSAVLSPYSDNSNK